MPAEVSKIDLNSCDVACLGCVKSYKKKHFREPQFDIKCKGIPLQYVPESLLSVLPDEDQKSAVAMLDPVTWAAQVLDWHCIDPDGLVWKRKSEEGSLPTGCANYYDDTEAGDVRISKGKSPFHRPYQKVMLQCTAKRKVFRLGRQSGKSETLVIAILFNLFVNKGFKVLLLTPFQSQIDLIFKRIEEFLNSNILLRNSVKRLIKAPQYTMELYNLSQIKGFTAGTQSKSNAAAIRGQAAHMIVFDESDYLSSGDLDAAIAVTTNFPNATVWMSSTPTGRREKFYEICHSRLYKEFHFPSYINPNWSEEIERDFRNQFTEAGYKHEIEADFGDIEEGVFQSAYVDAAKTNTYQYPMRRQQDWQYCIGVDWNDVKIGTTISVVGFNPGTGKFYVCDRKVISRTGWTQLAACEEIVKFNRKWAPVAIYVDSGFGSTQVEVLTKFAMQAAKRAPLSRDAAILKILKAYNFSSMLEVKDPFTNQPVKKASKPFLVENTVRRFENKAILFPDKDIQLEAELRGYIIDHVSPNGIPVYKASNEKAGDHNLDALMLALVAFQLELTDIKKMKFGTPHVAFAGRFGQAPTNPWEEKKQAEGNSSRMSKLDDVNEINRTSDMEPRQPGTLNKDGDQMPGAHLQGPTNKNPAKLWSWDGFNRDEPLPKPKIAFNHRNVGAPPKRRKF